VKGRGPRRRRSIRLNPDAQPRAIATNLSDEIVCTIDPDDAKDYDDASASKKSGKVVTGSLAFHIADVFATLFVKALHGLTEARERGKNSTISLGFVIPMLP